MRTEDFYLKYTKGRKNRRKAIIGEYQIHWLELPLGDGWEIRARRPKAYYPSLWICENQLVRGLASNPQTYRFSVDERLLLLIGGARANTT